VGASSTQSSVGLWSSIRLFSFPPVLPSGAWGFLLSLNHDWFACQRQRAQFLRKGSHKGPLFRMFPLSLQSIISNQMRPRRLRGAWFSRLLRHPARRWSGSILSRTTHTGSVPMSVLCLNLQMSINTGNSQEPHAHCLRVHLHCNVNPAIIGQSP